MTTLMHPMFERLCALAGTQIPDGVARAHKGAAGQWVERAIGLANSSRQAPDVESEEGADNGFEIKTVPVRVNAAGKITPIESVYVTRVPIEMPWEDWHMSAVRKKLQRVAFVPLYVATEVGTARRMDEATTCTIGRPSMITIAAWDESLQHDYDTLHEKALVRGLDALSATLGKYLQIRPKAASSKVSVLRFDAEGAPEHIHPKGFYLRAATVGMMLAG